MTGQLTPDILLSAYRAGIFPMAESATHKNIFWVDPKYRGILPLNKFHVSRSLSELIIDGIDTTIPLFDELLNEDDIINGDYNIHWLENWLEQRFQ